MYATTAFHVYEKSTGKQEESDLKHHWKEEAERPFQEPITFGRSPQRSMIGCQDTATIGLAIPFPRS